MLVVASGVTIGMATKDLVERILNKAISPVITVMVNRSVWIFLLNWLEKRLLPKRFVLAKQVLGVTKEVVWDFLLWLVLVFLSVAMLWWFLQVATTRDKLIDIDWYKNTLNRMLYASDNPDDAK